MRIVPALLLPLALLACTTEESAPANETLNQFIERVEAHSKPNPDLIDSIERRLAGQPCIGDISSWDRQYTYALPSRQVDESVIEFVLRKAGRYGVAAGRRIDIPGATVTIDDTPVKMVFGKFERKTGNLRIEFCGDNVPGAP